MEGTRLLAWLAEGVKGDLDCYAIFADELPRTLNFFPYSVLDPASAEDLTSIACEKAWRARAGYRSERGAVSTWLLAIARNVAIDHLRRARVEVPFDANVDTAEETTPESLAVRRQEI